MIETVAFADMLLVDGDPTTKLDLIANPEADFKVIMKGGQILMSTL